MGMEQFNPEPLSLKGIWTWMQQFELYLEAKNLKICKPPLHCTWQTRKPLKCTKLLNGIKPFMARFETLETMLPEEDVFISQTNHWNSPLTIL